MSSISAAPKSLKIVLRTVGTINILLAVVGVLFLVGSVHEFLTTHPTDRSIPYFRFAFIAMTNINVAFLGILLITAIRFTQVRPSAINLYSAAVLALFLYDVAIAEFWRIGGDVGISVAAATTIGNRATGLFRFFFLVPYLYPLTSVILLQVFKGRHRTSAAASALDNLPRF